MGRGDKKSKKGKQTMGSFGVKRRARVQTKILVNAFASADTNDAEPEKKKTTRTKKTKEA